MKERILEMLGEGVPQVAVSAALGVSESYVSQLMNEEEFAAAVAERRYKSLSAHTARDRMYDTLEDKLLSKLDSALPQFVRPAEILAGLKVLNGAKRRGAVHSEMPTGQTQTVVLNIPQVLVNKFSTNIQRQVVQVGDTPLITIGAEQLLKTVGAKDDTQLISKEGSSA